MFCEKCGAELENDALFCDSCGAKVNRDIHSVESSENAEPVVDHPSAAMESINNAYQATKQTIDHLELNSSQKTLCIMSAVSALFALITFNRVFNWVTLLSAAFLCYLCIKKERYDTKLMAIPFTVYFAKELISWLFRTLPYLRYQPALTGIISVVMFLLDVGAVVLYWLIVLKKTEKKKECLWIIVAALSINIVGILANFVLGYVFRFLTILYYLSMGLLMGVYLIMILKAEKNTLVGKVEA